MKKIALLGFASLCCLVMVAQRYTGKTGISPQEKLNNEYCNGLFKTSDGTIIDLLNDNETAKSYLNVLEWLQGRVAGLQIYYNHYGTPVPFIRNTRASLFVDEMPVDPAFLKDLSIADIAMIKIIKGPFAGAVGNGTIAIYTIKGDDEEEDEPEVI